MGYAITVYECAREFHCDFRLKVMDSDVMIISFDADSIANVCCRIRMQLQRILMLLHQRITGRCNCSSRVHSVYVYY